MTLDSIRNSCDVLRIIVKRSKGLNANMNNNKAKIFKKIDLKTLHNWYSFINQVAIYGGGDGQLEWRETGHLPTARDQLKMYFSKCIFQNVFFKMYFSKCISQKVFLKKHWVEILHQQRTLCLSSSTSKCIFQNVFFKMSF